MNGLKKKYQIDFTLETNETEEEAKVRALCYSSIRKFFIIFYFDYHYLISYHNFLFHLQKNKIHYFIKLYLIELIHPLLLALL